MCAAVSPNSALFLSFICVVAFLKLQAFLKLLQLQARHKAEMTEKEQSWVRQHTFERNNAE